MINKLLNDNKNINIITITQDKFEVVNDILFGNKYNHTHQEIINGTTYQYKESIGKAMEAVCTIHKETPIFVQKFDHYIILFISDNNKYNYVNVDLLNKEISIYSESIYSQNIYVLLYATIIILYKHKMIEKEHMIIDNWLHLDMNKHTKGTMWDADEQMYIENIALHLTRMLKSIIENNRFYSIKSKVYLNGTYFNRMMLEKMENIENITATYIFNNAKNEEENKNHMKYSKHFEKKDTHGELNDNNLNESLFNNSDIAQMPMELQVNYEMGRITYNRYKDLLDNNDYTLIKAFKSGKIWSAGYYGPSGTGKTTRLLAVAGALGLPFIKVVGSRDIDESYLLGKYILKNGETVFQYGPLSLAMKYGAMFIFDEINMVDCDVIACLNDILDGSRSKVLDNGEVITAHKNFRFCESMNIGYSGTNDMNISHKSRIQMKNKISKVSLEKMVNAVILETGINRQIATKMCNLIDKINFIIKHDGNELSQRIDTRHVVNWANLTMILDDNPIEASLTTIISSLTEDDDSIENISTEDIINSNGIAREIFEIIKTEFE